MSRTLDAVVVMPAHDGAVTIADALRSAIASIEASGRTVAISVADDASTDDTVTVVGRVAASTSVPIVLTRRPVNGGTGAARNTAVEAVDAPVLLFLDQDDVFLRPHVGTCLDALDADSRIDVVVTGVVLDRSVHPDWVGPIEASLTQNRAVRRHAHRLVGGFLDDPATAAVGCDDVLYNRLLARWCRSVRIDEATVRFRHRPGNSFDRQYDAKFARPMAEAVGSTMGSDRAARVPAVAKAFEVRADEVAARAARLGRPGVHPWPVRGGRSASPVPGGLGELGVGVERAASWPRPRRPSTGPRTTE